MGRGRRFAALLFALLPPWGAFVSAAEAFEREPVPLTADLRARLDSFVTAATGNEPNDAPAVAIAVVRDEKLAYERAAGVANLAADVPATTRTRFRIGSITKMFTAVAVLQLAERGNLGLDDALLRYLPWAPHAAEITIRQLLLHTSGLPNYLDRAFAGGSVATPAAPRTVLGTVAKQPLEFTPGTRYAYSNTGYLLLGLVVEARAGEPLGQYERTHIFEPAHMHDTSVGTAPPATTMAVGYQNRSGVPAQHYDASWLFGDGDGVATAGDVARFDIALMNGTLLRAQTLAAMQAAAVPTGQGDERYGLGVSIAPFGALSLVGHHGGLPGFECDDELLPAKGSAIVILSNAFTFRTSYVLSDFLATLFPQTFAASIAEVQAGIVEVAPGEDPSVSASLRRLITALQRGTLERRELDAAMDVALAKAEVSSLAVQLAPLGRLESLIFRGKSTQDALTLYRYVAIFSRRRVPVTLVLDAAGKIAGLWFR
jgi:D-alanyl-D-alanine carboxypeptidase